MRLLICQTYFAIKGKLNFLLLFAASVFVVAISHAQSNAGKLTGTITDATTNQPVSNVSIQTNKTKTGATSISDGTYILSLPAGTYTITYSIVGYQSKVISDVSIKAGQTTYQNILLESGAQSLQGVTVTATSARKEAQSALYNVQKRSAAASDGISQEAIRRTPDNNAGQVLRRVVGLNVQDNRFVVVRGLNDQYNQTTLNGVPMTSTETNRNAFSFNLIPAAAIDNIVVNKTATPDMPGNFAGGIVQINTKDFPAKDFYSITIQPSFADGTINRDFYSDKKNPLAFLGFANKDLNLPSGFPTAVSENSLAGMNIQERSRFLKMLPNNLVPDNKGHAGLNETFQLGYGKTIKLKNRNQFGVIVALNQRMFKLTENEISARDPIFTQSLTPDTIQGLRYYSQNIRFRYQSDFGGVANFAYSFGQNKIALRNLFSQTLNNLFIYRPLVRLSGSDFFNVNDKSYIGLTHLIEQKTIFNSTLSGEHRTGKNNETRLDWNVNATINNTNTPDTRNFLFELKDSTKSFYGGSSNVDFLSSLSGFSRVWSENKDDIYGGAFNITTPVSFLHNKHVFKSGILFQNRTRTATGTILPYAGLPDTTLGEILSPGNYAPSTQSEPYGIDISLTASIQASTSSNYNATSNLLAAYESLENRFGKKWRIIWGLRFEDYQQTIAVFTPVYQRNFEDPLDNAVNFGARTTFNFLPSVNVVYSPTTSVNIRAAYSHTVIRPELKDLAPFQRYDYENFQLTQGNQFLKSSSVTNYDLKLEWFPSASEIISVSGFYKTILNPIEYSRGESEPLNLTRFVIPVNTGDAYVMGAEMEIRKKIDFIKSAPWLNNVTLFGNGTLLKSHVDKKTINDLYFTYVAAHSLTGQANYIINGGFTAFLLKNTLEVTASFNKTGDYTNQLGSSDLTRNLANGDSTFETPPFRLKSRNLLDIVISKLFWKDKLRARFNIINLLKENTLLYQDVNGNGKFDDPIVIDTKLSELNYKSGTDNTASLIKGQRVYQLGITFTF